MRDMLGREDAVSVAEAQKRMEKHIAVKKLRSGTIAIEEAYGRILSEDVSSPEDLPPFARSTVDGYAVKSSDTFGATEGFPAYLNVTGEILMGEEPSFAIGRGGAAKIATGGMLPDGADAVVMLEHTQHVDESLIEVLKPVAPGENVISAGEDVGKGELLLERGHLLRPQDIAALAGVGIVHVAVYEKPKVAIVSTGDEIVPARHTPGPGQVRDINSYTLAGLIARHGGLPVKKGIFKDVYEEIRGAIETSLGDSDIVLVTGGSSVGAKDMTAEIINSLGSPGVLFHGVTLKPGKPTIGAVVDGVPVIGLPGHPAAVAVCFDLFIRSILEWMSGKRKLPFMPQEKVRARIARNISSSAGREEHIRVALEERDGDLWAVPILGKSGLIRTLVKAHGTVVVPAASRGIEEGEVIEVFLF